MNARQRYNAHHYRADTRATVGVSTMPVRIPENIERRDEHSPCFKCGTAAGCRHRPWISEGERVYG